MGRAYDGSHISAAANNITFSCTVCGGAAGDEQWWIVEYPTAVHSRCRDWGSVEFPFGRHLSLLGRLRHSAAGEVAVCVDAAAAFLERRRDAWRAVERRTVSVVKDCQTMLRRLRRKLYELDVSEKYLNQI